MAETIVGLATPVGRAGIAVIRLSGDKSLEIANKIFTKQLKKSHLFYYGRIVDGKEELDEALLVYMKSPKSYTAEDVVEIHCHGNPIIVNKIFELILQNKDVSLAKNGEFTKRAFLNGRIDLTQAEAIADLISAKRTKTVENSLKNLNGFLRDKVRKIKQIILDALSGINAVVDYPEEVEDNIDSTLDLERCLKDIKSVIDAYDQNKSMDSGLKLAIIGRPNVGKSSIMNRLLKKDKAIVTEVAGTTRDLIEDSFEINGILINLVDTAGIRESEDIVEKIGISLSKKALQEADVIIFVVDSSSATKEDEILLYDQIKDRPHIVVINKIDKNIYKTTFSGIPFSAKESESKIIEDAILSKIPTEWKIDDCFINNSRQRDLFLKVHNSIEEFLASRAPLDIASIHLNSALLSLGEIVGEISNDDLLDNIFANFCLGK